MKTETVVSLLIGAVVGAAACYAFYGSREAPKRVVDDPADLNPAPGVPPFVPGVLPEGAPRPTPQTPAQPVIPGLNIPIPPGIPIPPIFTA